MDTPSRTNPDEHPSPATPARTPAPTPSHADPLRALRRGLLDFAVLASLSGGARYAGELLAMLADTPFATQEGTLYPLLGKLRRDGLLEHEWVESSSGPPRKYHALTDAGHEHLTSLRTYWAELSSTLDTLGAAA